MKLKHTSGPWEKDYGSTEGHIKSIGIPEYNYTPTVCRYKNLYKGDLTVADSLSIEEQEANGRLIALAPEMLEILIEDIKLIIKIYAFITTHLKADIDYRI